MKKINEKTRLTESKEYSIPLPDYQEFPEIESYVVQVTDIWAISNFDISFVSDPDNPNGWDCLDENIEKAYRFSSFEDARLWIEETCENAAETNLEWLNADHSLCRCFDLEFEVKVLACVVTAELQLMDLDLDKKRSRTSKVREDINKDFEDTSVLELDFPDVENNLEDQPKTTNALKESRSVTDIEAEIAKLQAELEAAKVAEKRASYGGNIPTQVWIWDICLEGRRHNKQWTSAELYKGKWDGVVFETKDEAIDAGYYHLRELEDEGELPGGRYDVDEFDVDAFTVNISEVDLDTLEFSDLEHLI